MLGRFFLQILNMSLTAGVMILAVVLIRILLRKAPKIFPYCLWAVVLFRLICPISFSSPVSLLGALGAEASKEGSMTYISVDFLGGPEDQNETAYPANSGALYGQQSWDDINGLGQQEGTKQLSEKAVGNNQAWYRSVNLQDIFWPAEFSAAMRFSTLIWIMGILGFSVYSAVSIIKLKGGLRSAKEEISKGNIGVFRSDKVKMPFVIGFFRPNIYLPEDMELHEQSYILIHERVHIRRGDHIWRILAYTALCLHWFNPLVWVAFFLSERDMEMSCDEAVIRKFGSHIKKEYSTSLLTMSAGIRVSNGISPAFAEGDTGSRIRNVLHYKKPTVILLGTAVVISILTAVFLLGNPAKASQDDQEQEAYMHYAIVKEVNERQDQKDGSTIISLVLSSGYRVVIGDGTSVEPYFEFDMSQGIQVGDLVRLTFPKGEEIATLETYPAQFSQTPELVEVMGRSFGIEQVEAMEAEAQYRFTVPQGMAPDAKKGDYLNIWHYPDVERYLDPYGEEQEPELLANTAVLEVDEWEHHIWVQLSQEQVDAFMREFGFGIFCTLDKSDTDLTDGEGGGGNRREISTELRSLTAQMLVDERIPDGEYLVLVSSLSYSEGVIDGYRVDDWNSDKELPKLTFSVLFSCWVYEETDAHYVERGLQDFVLQTEEKLAFGDVPLHLVFKDGKIVRAFLNEPESLLQGLKS